MTLTSTQKEHLVRNMIDFDRAERGRTPEELVTLVWTLWDEGTTLSLEDEQRVVALYLNKYDHFGA